jgi:prepilin-type N-terminal cleavage/methylation domain-containing protein
MPSRFSSHRQRAFTPIELLVVIIVVAILIAVAAPSLLGHKNKAHDSQARQYLAVTYRAAKLSWVENGGYSTAGVYLAAATNPATLIGQLQGSEPQLKFVDTATGVDLANPAQVQFARPQTDVVFYADASKSGKTYCYETVERDQGVVKAGLYWSWGYGALACGADATGGTPTANGQQTTSTNPPDPSLLPTDGAHPLRFPVDTATTGLPRSATSSRFWRTRPLSRTTARSRMLLRAGAAYRNLDGADSRSGYTGAASWLANDCMAIAGVTSCYPAYGRWPMFDSTTNHNDSSVTSQWLPVPTPDAHVREDMPGKIGRATEFHGGTTINRSNEADGTAFGCRAD